MSRLSRVSLAPVWVTLAAALMSLSWLLPNHSDPWTSFHSDAWLAAMLGVIGLVVLVRSGQDVAWNGLALAVAFLLPLPFLQNAFGLLPFAGQAWTATAYIVALLLSMLIGQQWQTWRPRWMGDILFLAIGIAAIASVALQLQQWLGSADSQTLNVWTIGSSGARPAANMAQPNQLATLLLWGLLACGWGVWRKQLGAATGALAAAFLLLGLAMTQSRSGMLGLLVMILAAWWGRRLWGAKHVAWHVGGLTAFYALAVMALPTLRRALLLDAPGSMVRGLGYELRPELWRTLIDAAWQRPWFGYGWQQVFPAQVAATERHAPLHHPFMQSHNLFLDFVLWFGIPVGLLLTVCTLAWLISAARRVRGPADALFFLFVLVIGVHAMLEFPLHYGYFLLPTGLVVGALNWRLKIWPLALPSPLTGRPMLLGIWCVGAALLGLIARDYFQVEERYVSLQLERSQIQGSRPAGPPDVLLLTHLREAQRFMKYEPTAGVSVDELQRARDAMLVWPSSRSFMTLAIVMGLNHRPHEAREWLVKMCSIVPRDQCEAGPARWAQAQKLHPELTAIEWPLGAAVPKPLP